MDTDSLADRLAPCGLRCDACLARTGGTVHQAAQALRKGLTGFSAHSQRFAGMHPAFADYPAFEALLEYLATGHCRGCRSGGCLLKGCGVQACDKLKHVAFCYQCGDFPCRALDGFPALRERWLAANRAMAEMGPEAYWLSVKDTPRY